MRGITTATMILVLGAASVTPAAAQQPARARMMMERSEEGGGPMGPLTSVFGKYAPDAILAMEDHLSLTAAQVAQLTTLVEEEKAAVMAAHHPAHAAHMELRKLQGAETPDLEAMRRFFMEHHTAEGTMQWVRVTYAVKARALLTAPQRAHIEQMGGGAHHE